MAIVFVGSVFSPYYVRARARARAGAHPGGAADPLQHVAINLALYSPGGGRGARWAMTERGGAVLQRCAHTLAIGPSQWHWDGSTLVLTLDERCTPLPRRLRGQLRLHPLALAEQAPLALDRTGAHHWWPIAPCARVEVDLREPAWRWRGSGYLDSNRGQMPLAHSFSHWQWARATLDAHHSAVLYDAFERPSPGAGPAADDDGGAISASRSIALLFDDRGRCRPFPAPPLHDLPASRWRLPRQQRSEAGAPPRLHCTLEDTPFYARSLVSSRWLGQPTLAMHESLSLDRFNQPWVQWLLPFRMPRRVG